jgi:hypothetical protein
MAFMGWFKRFLFGAPQDKLLKNMRSSDQAPASADSFSAEIRALTEQIKLLRDQLGGANSSISTDSGGNKGNSRGRRGNKSNSGRNRQRKGRDDNRQMRDNAKPRERKPVPDDAPVGLLVDYLKARDIWVYEGQDDLNRNEAFEHLARHLGAHFSALSSFYEKLKRCVANGRGQRIDIEHLSEAERSSAVQFGTLLHRHGMLKDFYYHRSPKKQLRVIPVKDGEIAQFLTGGWLEIYVSSLMGKRLRSSISPAKFQLMYNVKGSFSNGREFEADLMACVEGRLIWVECKTGHWQDYSARFRGLVKTFGTERTSAGLLLIKPPDAATRKRATDMLDMTLMSLDEVDDFISVFLGEEIKPKPRKSLASKASKASKVEKPPIKDTLIEDAPLENVDPAVRLGRVELEGVETPQRRRRRRRRPGTTRGPGASQLQEVLPVAEIEEASKSNKASQADKTRAATESTKKDSAKSPSLSSAKVEKPSKNNQIGEVKSPMGKTIAPDLSAMMAGDKKEDSEE